MEAQGQNALELGSALGGRIANPTGANALLMGGMAAAQSQAAANAYNPFATALTMGSQNPAIQRAVSPYLNAAGSMFSDGPSNVYGYGGQGRPLEYSSSMDFGI